MDVFKTHLHQHALEEDEQEDEDTQSAGISDGGVELEFGRGDDGENVDGCDTTSSSQINPSDLLRGRGPDGRACTLCGKVYKYLVSFQKRQQTHETESSKPQSQAWENLSRYECPDCGMSFIRRTRLLSHLDDHKEDVSLQPLSFRCDQCSKEFPSVRSWIYHMEYHETNPFWCLSCVQGFPNEGALDKHLQTHNRKLHKCNICQKSFALSLHLMNHYNIHNGVKPYNCTLCEKSFYYPRHLIAHRKSHFCPDLTPSAAFQRRKGILFTRDEDKPKMDANMENQPGKVELMEQSEHQKPCEGAGSAAKPPRGASDCGEPVHLIKRSRLSSLSGSHPLEGKSETVEPQVGQELEESKSHDVYMHKYWEWECWECDTGFDEVEELHLHYIKHATGELPILPQDVSDG